MSIVERMMTSQVLAKNVVINEQKAEIERLRASNDRAKCANVLQELYAERLRASNAELVRALREIADEHPYPGMGEGLQEIARDILAKTEEKS